MLVEQLEDVRTEVDTPWLRFLDALVDMLHSRLAQKQASSNWRKVQDTSHGGDM